MTKSSKPRPTNYKYMEVRGCAPKQLMDKVDRLLNGLKTHDTTYAVEVLLTLVQHFQRLASEVSAWRRLWCDQPEDRLYHAKDRTWWMRRYGNENRGHGEHPESPYGAEPPPEIMRIVRAARTLPRKSKQLIEDLSYFPK